MSGTTILPTQSCFDDALEFLASAIEARPDWTMAHLRLVHGICLAPADTVRAGDPFAHAWVEQDKEIVIQAGIFHEGAKQYYGLRRGAFYAALRVQTATVYTLPEVARLHFATGHRGPWEASYRALCGGGHIFWEHPTPEADVPRP